MELSHVAEHFSIGQYSGSFERATRYSGNTQGTTHYGVLIMKKTDIVRTLKKIRHCNNTEITENKKLQKKCS